MAIDLDNLLRSGGLNMAPQQAPAPQAPQAAQPAPQGLLGGFFSPDGRDARQRLAIGLEGMTMRPNQALIGTLQGDIEKRGKLKETAAQKNATVEWLRSRGRDDLAEAVAGGLPAVDALRMAVTPADPMAALQLQKTQLELEQMRNPKAAVAQSAIAKLEQDRRNGLITDDQYQAGLQALAPQGMTIESDGQGGFRMIQGAGAASAKPFTEGQSKDVVYATRARGALAALEPVADELTSLSGRAAAYDPTGFVRGRVQSPEFQVAKQAGDEFLQAILRKDTGAAITPPEQELYGVTYLPQPGDGQDVLQAKRAARQRALAAVEAGMMPAQIIAQERALSGAGAAPSNDKSKMDDDELLRKYGGE